MSTTNKRPLKNLYLPGIHLPVGGVVSILHRLSGVLLVVCLPLILWLLQQSLTDSDHYQRIRAMLATLPFRLFFLLLGIMLAHHLLAGLRHLLQDIEIGVTREGGRWGAWIVMLVVGLVSVVVSLWMFR
jgi:succinate dehydrogenase / fumarate reductase cytochrome b subunit